MLCLHPEPEVRCVWEPVGPTTVGPGSVTACRTAPGPAEMDVLLRAHYDGEREKQEGMNKKKILGEKPKQNNNYASVSSYTIMLVFIPNSSTPLGMLLDAPSKNLQTAR